MSVFKEKRGEMFIILQCIVCLQMQQDKEEPERKRRRTEAPSATITSSSQPAPGPSGACSSRSQPTPSSSGEVSGRPQPMPGSSTESNSRSQHAGESSRQQQHSSAYRLGAPPGAKPRHPQAELSGHPQVKTEPGMASVTSAAPRIAAPPAAVASTGHSSTQPTAVYDATVASSIKNEPGVTGFRPESHLTGVDARDKYQQARGHPNLPPAADRVKKSQKLTLQDYQQRVEQRPPPPVVVKTEQQQQPPPGQAKEPKAELKASPVKTIKKEGVISSVPQNVHLKEAKVLVQDLKDSHGQDRVLYANAEASRRRSLSQSQDDDGEVGAAARHSRSSGHQHQRHHHQLDQRQVLLAHRRHSGKSSANTAGGEVPEKPVPIKLHIKRDAGTLQIRNPGHESSSSSKSPASLKMKICRNPQTATMHSAEVAGGEQRDQGLKLRLPASSGRIQDKHSQDKYSQEKYSHHHASLAHGQHSNGGHERKHKHGSRSHTQMPGSQPLQYPGHPSAADKSSLHRSSSSSHVPPPPPTESGAAFGSSHQVFQQRKSQSRPTLKTQNSGFSFPEQFISPTVPDMIFEPDTPTDVNGSGLDTPQTPTPDNINRVKAQMQQLFTQTKNQQSTMGYPPHPVHAAMYNMYNRPTQPPLPPPLPQNPPPPPPPPPQ